MHTRSAIKLSIDDSIGGELAQCFAHDRSAHLEAGRQVGFREALTRHEIASSDAFAN
jgi:hypothetical protein